MIYSYSNKSQSARALSEALGRPLIRHENSRFRGRPWKTVVNWGSREHDLPEEVQRCSVINAAGSRDKLEFLEAVKGQLSVPEWTTDKAVASRWHRDGHMVVARRVLNGHSGAGIVICEPHKQLVDAPLYTRYVPKKDEFRVHVFGEGVGFVQRKAGKPGQNKNWKVRNLANGFVFTRHKGDLPKGVAEEAIKAVKLLDLDFGAVDVIFNEKSKSAFVLEVNTAPGLEERTLNIYKEQLERR